MNWLIFCFLEDFVFCAYYTGLSHIMYIYFFFFFFLAIFMLFLFFLPPTVLGTCNT